MRQEKTKTVSTPKPLSLNWPSVQATVCPLHASLPSWRIMHQTSSVGVTRAPASSILRCSKHIQFKSAQKCRQTPTLSSSLLRPPLSNKRPSHYGRVSCAPTPDPPSLQLRLSKHNHFNSARACRQT